MRCLIRRACGHTEAVFLQGSPEAVRRRMKVLSRMRCEACRTAAAHQLVIMRYAEYRSRFPFCRTLPGSYHPEEKTIAVFVPEHGEAELDDRAEELRAAVQILREQRAFPAKILRQAEASVQSYLRRSPLGSTGTAVRNVYLSLDPGLNDGDGRSVRHALLRLLEWL